ncbi:hypothetical protein QQF64_023555 [Cirrhinus molitorella]|uniref:Uncharacterized protein n=1 Tax=Cirrhinus molitorella TaxID=172907 RepID=A0ABR3NJE4_9TELE
MPPRKRLKKKKTGGGPAPPQYTPAEELALELNENRTIVEGIPGGSSSSDPKPGTSSSNTFITVLHNTPTFLPVPKQVVAEAYADSEETLSDDCPLEEEPESTPRERPTERLSEESAQRTDTEGDIRSLYKRHLQQKIEYFDLKKHKLRGEIELDNFKKRKIALEIELLQKDLQTLPLGWSKCTGWRSSSGCTSTTGVLSFLMVAILWRMAHATIMSQALSGATLRPFRH